MPPPRLFVLFAASAPIAAVLRRGPSKRWQVFRWELNGDQLTPGDVFFGSVYPDASDVSPDGRFLLLNWGDFHWPPHEEVGETWTTLSRLPSLVPIWRRPDEEGHYCVGGRFVTNGVHLNTWVDVEGQIGPFSQATPDETDLLYWRRSPNVSHSDRPMDLTLPHGAAWVMRDTRRRAIFVRDGCLYRIARHGEVLLHDFNPIEFGPRVANEMVKQWRARPSTMQ
ncbi:MAG: hypothetical protein AAGD32_00330 [Planctomycetota bacterium]